MRTSAFPLHALRGERFELLPNRVKELPTFRNHSGCQHPAVFEDLFTIHSTISTGRPLARSFYRAGIGRDVDHLLIATGIKHLHLGPWELGVLLYVVELDASVLLLEINGHRHVRRGAVFSEASVGAALLAVHSTPLDRECRILPFPDSKAA